MKRPLLTLALASALAATGPTALAAQDPGSADDRPNFIVIVADDLGYSDLGMFGGEIPTPRLDDLATQGVRYTNFYVAPSCSPTRSMLLSGTDHHLAGLGSMIERTAPNQEGQPGYEGVLNERVAPLPALLRDAGYHTYMAGKWHLGKEPDLIPAARGFERDFSMLAAAGSHFTMDGNNWEVPDQQYTEDGEYITELPKGFYSTKTFTDKIIEQIESNRSDGQPFFAYLAHMAPHEPLQVPDPWLRRHMGRYDCGWDSVRTHRMDRLKDMGLVDRNAKLAHRMWFVPEFNAMTGLARYSVSRKMEIYASMVEYMDMEIGRLVDYLAETGELDNTYIIFFSDNGPETRDQVATAQQRPQMQAAGWLANNYTTDFANWGRDDSHMGYGMPWAQVSATPFYLAKGTVAEGGIRAPLIVVPPGAHTNGALNTEAILHVKDIAPTLLDIAGVDHPDRFEGRDVLPMQGESWVPMLEGDVTSVRSGDDWLGFELWGNRAVRQGPWKAIWEHAPFGTEAWELYDVVRDPGERVNRASEQPEIVRRLVALWDEYAEENGVILPNRHQFEGMEENLPPRPQVLGSWPPGSEENWNEPEDDEFFVCSVKSK
jgi:arylsulfatase